jgi:hypothetical protein
VGKRQSFSILKQGLYRPKKYSQKRRKMLIYKSIIIIGISSLVQSKKTLTNLQEAQANKQTNKQTVC